ncbi:MAG TPA: hypothetical protein VJ438_06435 [Candidatus Nanoarchaeia archaeon]|nr:hypothetical protein [Candidatus Nanoarchaeia archaeon]
MVKGKPVTSLVNLAAWITGVLVSFAVGFGMIGKTLTVPWLNAIGAEVVIVVAGWIVVVLTVISVVLAIADKL